MNPSVHTRFENEKSVYWGMRDELLKKHFGKWVAIVNGKVSAIGEKKWPFLRKLLLELTVKSVISIALAMKR